MKSIKLNHNVYSGKTTKSDSIDEFRYGVEKNHFTEVQKAYWCNHLHIISEVCWKKSWNVNRNKPIHEILERIPSLSSEGSGKTVHLHILARSCTAHTQKV